MTAGERRALDGEDFDELLRRVRLLLVGMYGAQNVGALVCLPTTGAGRPVYVVQFEHSRNRTPLVRSKANFASYREALAVLLDDVTISSNAFRKAHEGTL